MTEEIPNGKSGCPECHGEGYTVDTFGMRIRCSCTYTEEKDDTETKLVDVSLVKNAKYKDMICRTIPIHRRGDDYSPQQFKHNVEEMQLSQGCRMAQLESYTATVNRLLTEAAEGTINKSYLLSAPNGFSKTTLVNTIIKRYIFQDKTVVPYIDLSLLAELRFSYEKHMESRLWGGKSEPKSLQKFTWKHWLTADFVAVKLTEIESATIESSILSSLLSRRGDRNLPTLVTMQYTIKPYLDNSQLRRVYWDNMLVYNESHLGTDRLIYRGTYKKYAPQTN